MTEVRQRKNAQEDENEKSFRETDHVNIAYSYLLLDVFVFLRFTQIF